METGDERETGLDIFIVSGKCDQKRRTVFLYRTKKSDMNKEKLKNL